MAGPDSIRSRSWAGSSMERKSVMGCSTLLSKSWKSSRCRPSMKWPVELVTVTPTFTRFTEMRMGGVCCWICAATREAVQSKENRTAMIGCPAWALWRPVDSWLIGLTALKRRQDRRTPKLFEPFVEVKALGIFPGGAGQVMEVAGEDFGVYVQQPIGNLRRR